MKKALLSLYLISYELEKRRQEFLKQIRRNIHFFITTIIRSQFKREILKLELYQFIAQFSIIENFIIRLPKIFLTARLKSNLFNNIDRVNFYA